MSPPTTSLPSKLSAGVWLPLSILAGVCGLDFMADLGGEAESSADEACSCLSVSSSPWTCAVPSSAGLSGSSFMSRTSGSNCAACLSVSLSDMVGRAEDGWS